MQPNLAGTAFYLVLLPLLGLVGGVALRILFLALVEPWTARAAVARSLARGGQGKRGQQMESPAEMVIHPRQPAGNPERAREAA